jgi:hypothetical protein
MTFTGIVRKITIVLDDGDDRHFDDPLVAASALLRRRHSESKILRSTQGDETKDPV